VNRGRALAVAGRALAVCALAVCAVSVALAVTPAPMATTEEPFRPVARGLEFPTNMAFAPDGRVFFTEKETGRVRILRDGRVLPGAFVDLDVVGGGERGLLGIALHPEFDARPWVYLYLSDAADGRNRVVRIRADGDRGGAPETVLDGLPAVSSYHNGGDMAFGSDGMLLVVTGEAHDPELAQEPSSPGGKILRVEPDGSVPRDNPFGRRNPVYALGIRNSFGICVSPVTGDVWETENGPDRDDEVNRIEPGANYGWPVQLGPGGEPRFVDPQLVYPDQIVPTGCAVSPDGSSLFFGDYRGVIHRAKLAPPRFSRVSRETALAALPAGVVDVAVAPDRFLWVATPDTLWRSTFRLGPAGAEEEPDGQGNGDPGPSPTVPPSVTPSPPRSEEGPGAGPLPWILGAIGVAALAGAALVLIRRRG